MRLDVRGDDQNFGPVDPAYVGAFQSWPEWSVLWNDADTTWFMYGSALYLPFLHDRYFGDDRFLPELWRAVRNTAPPVNSPHWVSGLDGLLAPKGATFLDTVPLFARWRYYAGSRDDGAHLHRRGLAWPEMAFVPEATLTVPTVVHREGQVVLAGPMALGTVYVEPPAGLDARALSSEVAAAVEVVARTRVDDAWERRVAVAGQRRVRAER
jgi:hypothetical protein